MADQQNVNVAVWQGVRCDVFCRVVDNYGDIGVCWRLVRQLHAEYGLQLRLWVDDWDSFARLCPELQAQREPQTLEGVQLCRWREPFVDAEPATLVIETFACHLPDNYQQAMAARESAPIWINLDYLTAESWVSAFHGLPSPHPQLGLNKYFYFPGFVEGTGGLLRESDLLVQREAFTRDSWQQQLFWQRLGMSQLPPQTLVVTMFCYPQGQLLRLLQVWCHQSRPVLCLLAEGVAAELIAQFVGRPLGVGQAFQCASLTLRVIPFLAQTDYDRLLWLGDINFVRGEDSFVRAQWAAKPMCWHIYPQQDKVHLEKLEAFLQLYAAAGPESLAPVVTDFWQAWNQSADESPDWSRLWAAYLQQLPALQKLAADWCQQQRGGDLVANLLNFCQKIGTIRAF